MMFEETIAAFRNGALELDVPRILMQRSGAEQDNIFGPSTIRQGADGQINVKCHAAFSDGRRVMDLINQSMISESGELFADGDYSELSVTDMWGRCGTVAGS